MPGCEASVGAQFWGTPLCSADFLRATALTTAGVTPRVALARVQHLATWLRTVKPSVQHPEVDAVPQRRLSDLVLELQFLEVQLRVLQETGKPHRTSNLQGRIAALHRRLDALERRLRLRAHILGADERASLAELRRQIGELEHRHYRGPERRRRGAPPPRVAARRGNTGHGG